MRFCWANAFAILTVCSVVWFSFSAVSLMVCHVPSFSRSKKSWVVANHNTLLEYIIRFVYLRLENFLSGLLVGFFGLV